MIARHHYPNCIDLYASNAIGYLISQKVLSFSQATEPLSSKDPGNDFKIAWHVGTCWPSVDTDLSLSPHSAP